MKINLGCGYDKIDDYEGIDYKDFGQKYIIDLQTEKLPFEDGSIEAVRAWNFFEHIEKKYIIHIFNECHRVLKNGGSLEFIVPNAAYPEMMWQDPTHVSAFVKGTFTAYFTGQRPRGSSYGILPWTVALCEDFPKEPRVIHCILIPNK